MVDAQGIYLCCWVIKASAEVVSLLFIKRVRISTPTPTLNCMNDHGLLEEETDLDLTVRGVVLCGIARMDDWVLQTFIGHDCTGSKYRYLPPT